MGQLNVQISKETKRGEEKPDQHTPDRFEAIAV